jgi:hypothetical protein
MQRKVTAEELEQAGGHDVTGLEHLRRREQFVTEPVGFLEGFNALLPDMEIRKILVRELEPILDSLKEVDVDSLPPRDLRTLSKRASEVDGLMERLRVAVSHARRLLTRSNVAQLAQFALPRDGARFVAFAKSLPEE